MGLYVPVQGDGSVTMSLTMMWKAAGSQGPPQHLVWASQHCTGSCQVPRGCGDEDVAVVSQCHCCWKGAFETKSALTALTGV